MGKKFMVPELTVIRLERDFDVNPQAAVGALSLGDLPTNFVIQSMRLQVTKALTVNSTVALGEDGGGDADGYLAAVDPTDLGSNKCTGALLGAAGGDLEHVVADGQDGLILTSAVAAIITGKIHVYIQGYQMA